MSELLFEPPVLESSRSQLSRASGKGTIGLEVTNLLARETDNLGTLTDKMVSRPAVRAWVFETLIANHNGILNAAAVSRIDMRWQCCFVDVAMNNQQNRGIAITHAKMLALSVGAKLLNEGTELGPLVADDFQWEFRWNSSNEDFPKFWNSRRREPKRMTVDADGFAEQLDHVLLFRESNLELGVTDFAAERDYLGWFDVAAKQLLEHGMQLLDHRLDGEISTPRPCRFHRF